MESKASARAGGLAMHAPVGIHHALMRVGRHAGRAHMMIAADRVGGDERIIAPQFARLVQPAKIERM